MSSTRKKAVDPAAERKRLRNFGLIMAGGLAVVGGVFLWRGKDASTWIMATGGLFLLVGLTVPGLLRPVEKVWLLFGEVMSWIMTRVILTLTFYLVMTPLGLVIRVFGKDSFGKRLDSGLASYWVPVEPDGPMSRPDKPY